MKLNIAQIRYGDQVDKGDFRDLFRSYSQELDKLKERLGTTKGDNLKRILSNAQCDIASEPFQIASGLVIVDPDQSISDVEKLPNVNPAFIGALRQEKSLIAQGTPEALDQSFQVNKNGSGYIPVFQSPAHQDSMSSTPVTLATCGGNVASGNSSASFVCRLKHRSAVSPAPTLIQSITPQKPSTTS